jgi:hypothetical protein
MRSKNSAGTDASRWRSKDPYSLYRALNSTERAELEKLASDYGKFEDRMERSITYIFARQKTTIARTCSVTGAAGISRMLLTVVVLTVQTMRSFRILKPAVA